MNLVNIVPRDQGGHAPKKLLMNHDMRQDTINSKIKFQIQIQIKHIVPPVLSIYMEWEASYLYSQKDHHDQIVAPQQENP